MKDTDPKTERKILELMKKKTGAERLQMGFSMYDMARKIVEDSIRAQFPNINPSDFKKFLFLRFYGNDFSQQRKETILRVL